VALSGVNATNVTGYSYDVYRSANLDSVLTNWTLDGTGVFDGTGGFVYSNTVPAGAPMQFYRLRMP
jgi:hypothetical protein